MAGLFRAEDGSPAKADDGVAPEKGGDRGVTFADVRAMENDVQRFGTALKAAFSRMDLNEDGEVDAQEIETLQASAHSGVKQEFLSIVQKNFSAVANADGANWFGDDTTISEADVAVLASMYGTQRAAELLVPSTRAFLDKKFDGFVGPIAYFLGAFPIEIGTISKEKLERGYEPQTDFAAKYISEIGGGGGISREEVQAMTIQSVRDAAFAKLYSQSMSRQVADMIWENHYKRHEPGFRAFLADSRALFE